MKNSFITCITIKGSCFSIYIRLTPLLLYFLGPTISDTVLSGYECIYTYF
jgi:hypothetical protein